jgi:hypothetical protein
MKVLHKGGNNNISFKECGALSFRRTGQSIRTSVDQHENFARGAKSTICVDAIAENSAVT